MLKELKKLKTFLGENRKRVFVGLSGGVDSSVAAYLLKQAGCEVVGIHLRCWNREGCDVREAEDARRVAEYLDIPFYVLDLEKEYKEKVVDYMLTGYARGVTPNPDVMCNKEIKFGLFLDRALAMGADYVATGHYVRLRRHFVSRVVNSQSGSRSKITNLRFSLWQAKDSQKDQSYFLWTLTQRELSYCLFPIGHYLKSEVRAIARKAGLSTADKKDSQGLCFVGKVTLKEFLSESLSPQRGKILDTFGKVIGEHDGIQFYTIGQRHGFKLGGGGPRYVVSKDAATNTLVLAEGSNHPQLFKKEIKLTALNWITGIPRWPVRVWVRVRYRQPVAPAVLSRLESSKYKLEFDEPQKFVAPGQSAVFYSSKGRMLGGGVIL